MKFKLFGHNKKTGGYKFSLNTNRCSYSPGYENNCAINAFRCIDIISDDSYQKLSMYARNRLNTTGITLCEIIHILRKEHTANFQIRVVTFKKSEHIKLIPGFLKKYSEMIDLQDGQCVLMSIDKDTVVNHMVVFAKLDNTLYIIDKQLQSTTCLESLFTLKNYFRTYINDSESFPGLTLSFIENHDDENFVIPMNKNLFDIIDPGYFDSCNLDNNVMELYEYGNGNITPPHRPTYENDGDENEDNPSRKRKRTEGGKTTKKRKTTKKPKTTKKRK
jgi:hypothetical protein